MGNHNDNKQQKNENIDLFGLQTAEDLYTEVRKNYINFMKVPDDVRFLLLIFTLNHLREWISECNWDIIKVKKDSKVTLTDAEQFFVDIFKLPEFKIINSLCNHSKHYITKKRHYTKTHVSRGFRAGQSRAGESLSHIYYYVDGKDIRDIFYKVMSIYDSWFKEKR